MQKSGTINLAGALSVDLLPGFTPATNDTFTVVTATTRSGTFSTFAYPANRATMLTATEVFPVPQPVLLAPQLLPPNILLIWTGTSNVTYRLESSPDLAPSNWNSVAGDATTLSNTASRLDQLTTQQPLLPRPRLTLRGIAKLLLVNQYSPLMLPYSFTKWSQWPGLPCPVPSSASLSLKTPNTATARPSTLLHLC